MTDKKKLDKTTLLLFAATILWMGVIFWFSSQPGNDSANVSGFVKNTLLGIINWLFNGNPPEFITGVLLGDIFIRKAGHVTEYFILGVLMVSLISRLGFKKHFIIAALICVLYAASDEFHQMFVPGRGPQVRDVLLDSVSALFGIILVSVVRYFRVKTKIYS